MKPLTIFGFVVGGLGILMVALGVIMNAMDWFTARANQRKAAVAAKAQSLEGSINALTKLVNALKTATPGTGMIAFGIVMILVGAIVLGVSGL